jgi:hypothetical protein
MDTFDFGRLLQQLTSLSSRQLHKVRELVNSLPRDDEATDLIEDRAARPHSAVRTAPRPTFIDMAMPMAYSAIAVQVAKKPSMRWPAHPWHTCNTGASGSVTSNACSILLLFGRRRRWSACTKIPVFGGAIASWTGPRTTGQSAYMVSLKLTKLTFSNRKRELGSSTVLHVSEGAPLASVAHQRNKCASWSRAIALDRRSISSPAGDQLTRPSCMSVYRRFWTTIRCWSVIQMPSTATLRAKPGSHTRQ